MSEEFLNAPTSSSVRLINFDKAQVVTGIVPGKYILVVSGTAPCINMQIALSPLIYIKQPDYWGIEVIGSLPGGICLPAMKPYTVSLPLDGILGKKGIEVIGANKRVKIPVPPKGSKKGGGGNKAAAKKGGSKKK
jgi:hypothetical protein